MKRTAVQASEGLQDLSQAVRPNAAALNQENRLWEHRSRSTADVWTLNIYTGRPGDA